MRDAGAAVLRLETRLDNVATQHLFAKCGFVQRGRTASYYEDGEDALLCQKSLWNLRAAEHDVALSAPYYGQTLDFTCGPCALLEIYRRILAHLLAKFEARNGMALSEPAALQNVLTLTAIAPALLNSVALRA